MRTIPSGRSEHIGSTEGAPWSFGQGKSLDLSTRRRLSAGNRLELALEPSGKTRISVRDFGAQLKLNRCVLSAREQNSV